MNTLEFLAQVSASIKANGKFVSGKDAKASGTSTTGDDAAFAVMDGETSFDASDLALAEEALTWIRSYNGTEKFVRDVAAKVALDDMLFSNAAIAAWAIVKFQQKDNGGGSLAELEGSVYYGAPDGEVACKATVYRVASFNGRYGPQSFVTFVDKANHVFLWKTSGDRATGLVAGASVRIIGTIKEHTEYQGVKQTRIVRPKITLL